MGKLLALGIVLLMVGLGLFAAWVVLSVVLTITFFLFKFLLQVGLFIAAIGFVIIAVRAVYGALVKIENKDKKE